jgi:apolipoprotein N-acyltransferase
VHGRFAVHLVWQLRRAQVLVNLANDVWFVDGVGPAQTLAQARWRAIETRRPLLRVSSGGTSAVVSPAGRLAWRSDARDASTYTAPVTWPATSTPYTRLGDVVVWLALMWIALAAAPRPARLRRRAARRPAPSAPGA